MEVEEQLAVDMAVCARGYEQCGRNDSIKAHLRTLAIPLSPEWGVIAMDLSAVVLTPSLVVTPTTSLPRRIPRRVLK